MFLILLLFTSSAVGLGQEVRVSNGMCPENWVDATSVEMGEFFVLLGLKIVV